MYYIKYIFNHFMFDSYLWRDILHTISCRKSLLVTCNRSVCGFFLDILVTLTSSVSKKVSFSMIDSYCVIFTTIWYLLFPQLIIDQDPWTNLILWFRLHNGKTPCTLWCFIWVCGVKMAMFYILTSESFIYCLRIV